METEALAFAYKYPFSKEAKEMVQSQANTINQKYLDLSGSHIEEAVSNGLEYNDIKISSVRKDYIMTYLYSRMLLSATKRMDLIKSYAIAEARRSGSAAIIADNQELVNISGQLGIRITETFDKKKDENGLDQFAISFTDYVTSAPKIPEFELVNQKLSHGIILLNKNNMVKVIEQAASREITKGLPIKSADLPKQVVDYSKTLKLKPMAKIEIKSNGKTSEAWIEKLLQTPIADVRHRTVNLILAPYLTNIKGLSVEDSIKIINDYIERCKQIDPNTKINERYIEYQCTYAKKRGLKPLSIDRARELLGSAIEINEISK